MSRKHIQSLLILGKALFFRSEQRSNKKNNLLRKNKNMYSKEFQSSSDELCREQDVRPHQLFSEKNNDSA